MGNFTEDKELTKTIITKRAKSLPLTDKEEAYSRQMFDHLMSSKRAMRKTVQMVTGSEIRKSSVDVKPLRNEPITRQADEPTGNVDNPTPVASEEKLADADNKPKQVLTENERLSNIIQTEVGVPSTEKPNAPTINPAPLPVAKVGDTVEKTFGKTLFKGTVQVINKNGVAVVKWADGRQTWEEVSKLTKATNVPEKGKKLNVPDVTYDVPSEKVTKAEEDESVVSAEEPAPTPAPVAEAPEETEPTTGHTPFEGMVEVLERVLDLARYIKECQADAGDDEEIVDYYETLNESLRETAESVLGALTIELKDTQEEPELENPQNGQVPDGVNPNGASY